MFKYFKKLWWRFRYNWYGWKRGFEWNTSGYVDDSELDYDEDPTDAFCEDRRG